MEYHPEAGGAGPRTSDQHPRVGRPHPGGEGGRGGGDRRRGGEGSSDLAGAGMINLICLQTGHCNLNFNCDKAVPVPEPPVSGAMATAKNEEEARQEEEATANNVAEEVGIIFLVI